MNTVMVNQLKRYFRNEIKQYLDIEDIESMQKQDSDKDKMILSRCLPVFAISALTGESFQDVAPYITDGFDDQGVDAIYWCFSEKTLYIVQSKLVDSDKQKPPGSGDILKFTRGVKLIVSGKYQKFNSKVNSPPVLNGIQECLENTGTKIVLLVVHTSNQYLSNEQKDILEESVVFIGNEIAEYREINRKELYSFLVNGFQSQTIDVDIQLSTWGHVASPLKAYYGNMSAYDIAKIYRDYQKNRLFSSNIREGLESSVNDKIVETLNNSPEYMWYFNNGITALVSSIDKTGAGGKSTEIGTFKCKNLRIVNGAQTVSSIAKAYESNPASVEYAKIHIRIISLPGTFEEFEGLEKQITRFNNTQNRVDSKTFVALDPLQDRIKKQLAIEGITYCYKAGDERWRYEKGFNFEQAIIALACNHDDVGLAVKAKDKISELWESTQSHPYTSLFNSDLDGIRLWRLVEISTLVEERLEERNKTRSRPVTREGNFAIHAKRFVLHLVYKTCRRIKPDLLEPEVPLHDCDEDSIRGLTVGILNEVIRINDELYGNSSHAATAFRVMVRAKSILERLDISALGKAFLKKV